MSQSSLRTQRLMRSRQRALTVESLESRTLLSVQIVGKTSVIDSVGKISLTLRRTGDVASLKKPEQVKVETKEGTAKPGTDYVQLNQILAFGPKATSKSVTIPIFPHDPSMATKTFELQLIDVTNPTGPGSPRSTTISIVHPTKRSRTSAPAMIKKTLLLTSGDQITAFVVTFDKPMDPTTVQDTRNYLIRRSSDGATISLSWASYNPQRRDVTLVPVQSGAIPIANYVLENPGPDIHSKIRDASGRMIDGVGDRMPNGILYATFRPGQAQPSPAVRAQILADIRIHKAQQAKRGAQLGGSLSSVASAFLL